jgi:hypothetical protein
MNEQDARAKVNDIVGQLIPLGLFPPGNPLVLPGNLAAVPERDLPTYWRPVFTPYAEGLSALDLEDMPSHAAARQIARYRFDTYRALRLQVETIFAEIAGRGYRPIPSALIPDSFIIGTHGLKIREDIGRDYTAAHRLVLETHPLMEIVEPGEAIPESREIDVTERSVGDIVETILDGINKGMP